MLLYESVSCALGLLLVQSAGLFDAAVSVCYKSLQSAKLSLQMGQLRIRCCGLCCLVLEVDLGSLWGPSQLVSAEVLELS